MVQADVTSYEVKAGDELSFLGNARQLQTTTSSFRFEPSDTVGVCKVVATRTGRLEATSAEIQGRVSSPAKKEKAKKRTQVDVVPFHATRYLPQVNDIVIGVVVQANREFFMLDINSDSYAYLNSLEFQGATKRDKPKFEEGQLVYCRVIEADGLASTKLSCISPLDKKAWNSGEAFFGVLQGGLVKDFPVNFCRSLLSQSEAHEHLLNQLGAKMEFEINIGFNGKIWVKGRMIDVVFIMNAFERFVQSKGDLDQVAKLLQVLN